MSNIFIRNYVVSTMLVMVSTVVLGYILISGNQTIAKSDQWIMHTQNIILTSEELGALISDMLAAQRGYMLSSDDVFLEDFEDKKASISRHITMLSELTADNLSQQSRLEEIRQAFINFSELLSSRASQIESRSPQEILSDVRAINDLNLNIRRINNDFLAEEYALLDERVKQLEQRKDQYFLTLVAGGGTTFVLLMLFNAFLLRVQLKRKVAENTLHEKEEIFRLAIEGTQDGVFDWNLKTNDVFYSGQFMGMLGYESNDYVGTLEDFVDKLHDDEKRKVQDYVKLYLNGQLSEYSQTFRMQHKSGRWVWIQSRAKMITDKKGTPIRLVGAHTDISATKEYENALQEAKDKAEDASRAKSDFLAHMSHEIRTPLTTISGVAEILSQSTTKFDDKLQHLIRVLNASTTTLKDLISDILDFSKIESGELEIDENAFYLADYFEQLVSIMSVRTSEKGLDFVFDYSEVRHVNYVGDPLRLRQIMMNLIGNAIKFTEEGYIHITAKKDVIDGVDMLRIDVKDSGIGLTEDQFDLVFERFKQADSSVSRKYGGTGLGLPISKKLATLMGGDILIESSPNNGSTFSLILPLRLAESAQKEDGDHQRRRDKINDQLKSTISGKDKVLLVEDYEGNIVVIGYLLEEMGLEFDVARTGLEALNLWKENHYDLILIDVQMPEMDGLSATSHIRDMEREQNLNHTPIIGMTAHALIGDEDKCIAAGMDAYLPKPIVEMDLKSTILKFLNQRAKAA